MQIIKLILLTLLVLCFISCSPKAYTRPEIGMKYKEFTDLCGQPISGAKQTQDANGSTLVVKMERLDLYPSDQSKNYVPKCPGTFTFENSKLTKIE